MYQFAIRFMLTAALVLPLAIGRCCQGAEKTAAQLLPASTVAYAEIPNPQALCDQTTGTIVQSTRSL